MLAFLPFVVEIASCRAITFILMIPFRHWQDTLAILKEPSDPDTDPDAVREPHEELHYSGPRIGTSLPLWYSFC